MFSPSVSLRVYPGSCSPLQWCCPAISSSDTLFSFYPQSFPASGTSPMSHLCTSDDQNTGASVWVSVLPVQSWSPLKLTGLISLLSKGLLEVFSSTTVQRHEFSDVLPSLTVQFSQPYVTTGKTIADFCLCFSTNFNTSSTFVIAFLPRSKHLLISRLQSPSAVILEPRRGNLSLLPPLPFYLPWSMGPEAMILVSLTVLSQLFHFPPLPSSRGSLAPPSLSAIRLVSAYLRWWLFLPPILILACNSSRLAFLMMCSVYRLNKQGDGRYPCHNAFSIVNESVAPCRALFLLDLHTGFSGDR